MIHFRLSTKDDLPRIMDIWRRAVDATHDFLAPDDRDAIEAELVTFFPQISLLLAVDDNDTPLGFMFLHDGHMEALFIDPNQHRKGIGKALIQRAVTEHPALTTDVNEQNHKALGFYEHQGFERTGRSTHDGQGRPYPLIHLRYKAAV
ncbi:acetyltransferase [Agrobacterium sp.]|jgi:putative acetyltransferase|uniref:acetyltransferase n=1 Tax=Agrobacterium sp. TaxID=361 RepID=UPI0028A60838